MLSVQGELCKLSRLAKLMEPIRHLLTYTIGVAVVVGLLTGRLSIFLLAVGVGMMVQCYHSQHTSEHEDEYTANPIFGVLGIGLVAVPGAQQQFPWQLLLLVPSLLAWEISWHKWRHRGQKPAPYARENAWIGLAGALTASWLMRALDAI